MPDSTRPTGSGPFRRHATCRREDHLSLTVDVLEEFVALDATSRISNLALIELVANRATHAGGRATVLPGPFGRKANLLVSFGPETSGGLVLSGHTDVVPVDGQQWTSDPFVLTARDDRLHGRGATEMKSFIACALSMLPALTDRTLRRPIPLALPTTRRCSAVAWLVSWTRSPTLIRSR